MSPGLWGGLGRVSLFVWQVALQRVSSGFASGEFAGRVRALLLLCSAQVLFPVVVLQPEFGSTFSHPVPVYSTGAALGSVLPQSEKRVLQRKIPYLLSCHPIPTSSAPSSKYRFLKLVMWAMLCLLRCPSVVV